MPGLFTTDKSKQFLSIGFLFLVNEFLGVIFDSKIDLELHCERYKVFSILIYTYLKNKIFILLSSIHVHVTRRFKSDPGIFDLTKILYNGKKAHILSQKKSHSHP